MLTELSKKDLNGQRGMGDQMVIEPPQVVLSQAGLDFIQNPQRTDSGDLTPQFMRSVTEIYLRITNDW